MEIAAGAFVHRAQEARLDPGPLPVLEDADLASTGQGKTADVQGVGGGVFAADVFPNGIADDVAAGIGAKAVDGHDALAQHLLGDGLHVVRQPKGERRGGFAAGLVKSGVHAARRGHAHAVEPAAALLWWIIGDRLGDDVGLCQNAPAKLGIVPEGGQPPIDKPGVGLAKIQRRQRIERRRHQALPEQQSRTCPKHRRQQHEQPEGWKAARTWSKTALMCPGGATAIWASGTLYKGRAADGQAVRRGGPGRGQSGQTVSAGWQGADAARAPSQAAAALALASAACLGLPLASWGREVLEVVCPGSCALRWCGDSLKVRGDAILFPVPVAGGLGPWSPADLLGGGGSLLGASADR